MMEPDPLDTTRGEKIQANISNAFNEPNFPFIWVNNGDV
jgi:hypothetical protein